MTWSPAGLAVFDVGQTTPRFRAAAVADAPLGAAWVDGPARHRRRPRPPGGGRVDADPAHVPWPTTAGRVAGGRGTADALPPPPAVSAGRAAALVDDVPAAGRRGDADPLACSSSRRS